MKRKRTGEGPDLEKDGELKEKSAQEKSL